MAKCAKKSCPGTLEISGQDQAYDIYCNGCGAVYGTYYSRPMAENELSYIEQDRRDAEAKQAEDTAELAALRAELEQARAEREGWKRLALYWRKEWRLYTKTYVGHEYVSEYIRLGSISRRHQRQRAKQAGE